MITYKTNSKQFLAHVNAYILDAINTEDYNYEGLNTDKARLQFLADTFKGEYCYPENLRRYGSCQECLRQWIMGLPTSFNIDYENYRIIELAKQWGSLKQDCDDRAEDKVLNNWFNLIAAKTLQLMAKHGIYLHS